MEGGHNSDELGDPLRRNPITGIVGCCARGPGPCNGRAAEQRDELAPFQSIGLHSIACHPEPNFRIPNSRGSVRTY